MYEPSRPSPIFSNMRQANIAWSFKEEPLDIWNQAFCFVFRLHWSKTLLLQVELVTMKLAGIVCIGEHYGAIFNMEKKLLCASGHRGHYFSDRKLPVSEAANPWHQPPSSGVRGNAGALKDKAMRAVVTGGGGYFGYKLGCALASSGASVVLYDIHKPIWEIPNGVVCIQVWQNTCSQQSKLVYLPFP